MLTNCTAIFLFYLILTVSNRIIFIVRHFFIPAKFNKKREMVKNNTRSDDRDHQAKLCELGNSVCTEYDRSCAKTHLHATMKVRVVLLI